MVGAVKPPNNCIKILRSTLGLSQTELARLVHMTRTRLEQIENSKRMPRLDEAQRLASALKSTIDEIFTTP